MKECKSDMLIKYLCCTYCINWLEIRR